MSNGKKSIEVAKESIHTAISTYGLPTKRIPEEFPVFRVQESRHQNPVYYNPDSDTRYGDPQKALGVCYVAASDIVAVAETLQHGKAGAGSPVLRSEIEERSLHQLETVRELIVVDAAELARNAGKPLRVIVESKGQGGEGYAFTQALSEAVMRHDPNVDGILYPSQVYPTSGSMDGCNIVLFGGRPDQLAAVSKQPLGDVVLTNGETVGELLNRMQVPVE